MTRDDDFDAAAASLGSIIDASDRFSDWRLKLILNDKKKPKACLANTLTALRHVPGLKGSFRYNEFAYRIEVAQPLPWDENQDEWIARTWTDDDDVRLAESLQRQGVMVKLGEVGRQ